MTIAIAIKTSSAVVFATDSKVSTQGVGGYNEAGEIVWRPQAYDNAYKLAHDQRGKIMSMVAGYGDIGRMTATDFITRYAFPDYSTQEEQSDAMIRLGDAISAEIRARWTGQIDEEKWPAPSLWVAGASPDGMAGRVWEGSFKSPVYSFKEKLLYPGIELDGSYREVNNLLYGIDWQNLEQVHKFLGVTEEKLIEAIKNSKMARPADKINFWTMPTQDAIELAVFLAKVQIQMDRFLPGEAACGGAIDVMVLQLTPRPQILSYLKELHYPKPND